MTKTIGRSGTVYTTEKASGSGTTWAQYVKQHGLDLFHGSGGRIKARGGAFEESMARSHPEVWSLDFKDGVEPRAVAYLGNGMYLTPFKSTAEFFAGEGRGAKVVQYRLPEGLNMLFDESEEFAQILESLDFPPWVKNARRAAIVGRAIREAVQKAGYDGMFSLDRSTGVVIYDPTLAEKL